MNAASCVTCQHRVQQWQQQQSACCDPSCRLRRLTWHVPATHRPALLAEVVQVPSNATASQVSFSRLHALHGPGQLLDLQAGCRRGTDSACREVVNVRGVALYAPAVLA